MKSFSRLRFLANALLLLVFLAGFAGTDPVRKYKKEVRKHRKDMDKEFRDPETSPLKEEAVNFKGLEYYPIDPAYRVVARFSRSQDETTFEMPTSNPKRNKVYFKYGVLDFELNGDSLQISVYRSPRLLQERLDLYLKAKLRPPCRETKARFLPILIHCLFVLSQY